MISPSEQYQPQIPQQPLQPQMYDPHMGPYQYQYPPPPPSHPMPSTSSAFYPPQPVHRDPMGECKSLEIFYGFIIESFCITFLSVE